MFQNRCRNLFEKSTMKKVESPKSRVQSPMFKIEVLQLAAPTRLLALFLSRYVTLVRLDLFTLSHQYFPRRYFIFPAVLQIQWSSSCGPCNHYHMSLIISHRRLVIDNRSETIGHRQSVVFEPNTISYFTVRLTIGLTIPSPTHPPLRLTVLVN